MPTASDIRVFVPAKDFALSKSFYMALGWQLNWDDADAWYSLLHLAQ
jgi:predicted lactoylglutathione lyase